VAAVGEGDVEVVDALVCLPERLALLLRHVRAVMLPWEGRNVARWPRHVILRPGRRRRQLA
jgi:hypothetical protein